MPADAPRATFPSTRATLRRLGPLPRFLLLLAALALVLAIAEGFAPTAQTTVNGLVAGSYFALGGAGLTLVYGVLRLVNFAHGDFLTFGAFIALAVTSGINLPLGVGVAAAVVLTALLATGFEAALWDPLRRRGAGPLQMILTAIGVAFVLRFTIQLIAGTNPRSIGVDVVSTVSLGPVRIGTTQLGVLLVGYAVLVALGLVLRFTMVGKQLRALSDDPDLAEVTGIDTRRMIRVTQLLAGALAGLAGVLFAASIGSITPNVGFGLLLSLFAATVLGGIGNAFGALIGGVTLGVIQEWSTLVIEPRWKSTIGFGILVAVLVLRPTGIVGRPRMADR